MTVPCPICATPATSRFGNSPYWMCPSCDCWFQSPLPPKLYEAAHEKDERGQFAGHLMSEHDREVNRQLARYLHRELLGGKSAKTLDIGSKYPFLAHCLRELGCDAFGMDNIEIVPDYARSLAVPMLMADFEQSTEAQIREWTATEKFALITLIHVFEHMYDPLATLRKLRRLIADEGVLFIRLPDHRVAGFERDLTPGHYTIHPFYHAMGSVLELLVQGRDLFTVAHTLSMEGAGQRDVVLRPLARKPVVYAGLIVKNEERDLPRCLKSIEPIVDAVVIVDTGSTDATLDVAGSTIAKPVYTQVYTGASRRDASGDWKLWDFSKARNVFVEDIERRGADYVLWMDADDQLLTPDNLRRALYWSAFDVFGMQIASGGQQWTHHRLWKTGLGIRYEGRCHEYPTIGNRPSLVLSDSFIVHDATPGSGETANARNLRILLEEFAEHPSPRTAFYLANTHRDAQRYAEAISWYDRRIGMGPGYRDEWLFAYLYKARCQRAIGEAAAAEATLLEAASHDRAWAEYWMELAYLAYEQKRYAHAIGYAMQAVAAPIPATQLWREANKYTDQPCRIVSWAHEHLGDKTQALAWAQRAHATIGGPDADWDQRISRLSMEIDVRPATATRPRIAVCRPGAIGDILMTLNLVPLLSSAYPGHDIHYYCHPELGEALASIMRASGVHVVGDSSQFVSRQHEYIRAFNLIGYPLIEGYPEKPMRQHLLRYFAEELGLEVNGLPALHVAAPPRPGALPERYATLQVKAGWSAYKNWPIERWEAVLAACPEVPVIQIGKADEPRVAGASHDYLGTPLPMAIALIAHADLHLGIDSFANHLTHYEWDVGDGSAPHRVPAVILWGSTQASAAGYPHNVKISLDLPCQPCFREDPKLSRTPRGVCVNPPGQTYERPRHACMQGIAVDRVAQAVQRLWPATPSGATRALSEKRARRTSV
jgi:ADP-heptose:LPS heptosyltransferase/glycosyltransferase involved in cell wall biosynthesis/SAM-dependent methyltransferase